VFRGLQGTGTANTALVYHAGRLFSLHEADQPYELYVHDDGRIETLGRVLKGTWFR
jgi:carotenoid 9,10(9',10')-cleavage dioxygenase 1